MSRLRVFHAVLQIDNSKTIVKKNIFNIDNIILILDQHNNMGQLLSIICMALTIQYVQNEGMTSPLLFKYKYVSIINAGVLLSYPNKC